MTSPAPAAARQWLEQQSVGADIRFEFIARGTGHCLWLASQAGPRWVIRERRVGALGYVADYRREQAIWQLAAASGLAPRLLACLDAGRVWISEWVAGSEDRKSPSELGQLRQRIAELGKVQWRLDLRTQLANYCRQSYRQSLPTDHGQNCRDAIVNGARLDETWETVMRDISQLEAGPTVLCHNDLLPANVLGLPGQRRVIDWEYAAMGSPYFDAAATLAAIPVDQHGDYLSAAFPGGWDAALLQAGQRVYRAMDAAWRCTMETPEVQNP